MFVAAEEPPAFPAGQHGAVCSVGQGAQVLCDGTRISGQERTKLAHVCGNLHEASPFEFAPDVVERGVVALRAEGVGCCCCWHP